MRQDTSSEKMTSGSRAQSLSPVPSKPRGRATALIPDLRSLIGNNDNSFNVDTPNKLEPRINPLPAARTTKSLSPVPSKSRGRMTAKVPDLRSSLMSETANEISDNSMSCELEPPIDELSSIFPSSPVSVPTKMRGRAATRNPYLSSSVLSGRGGNSPSFDAGRSKPSDSSTSKPLPTPMPPSGHSRSLIPSNAKSLSPVPSKTRGRTTTKIPDLRLSLMSETANEISNSSMSYEFEPVIIPPSDSPPMTRTAKSLSPVPSKSRGRMTAKVPDLRLSLMSETANEISDNSMSCELEPPVEPPSDFLAVPRSSKSLSPVSLKSKGRMTTRVPDLRSTMMAGSNVNRNVMLSDLGPGIVASSNRTKSLSPVRPAAPKQRQRMMEKLPDLRNSSMSTNYSSDQMASSNGLWRRSSSPTPNYSRVQEPPRLSLQELAAAQRDNRKVNASIAAVSMNTSLSREERIRIMNDMRVAAAQTFSPKSGQIPSPQGRHGVSWTNQGR